MKRTKYIVAFMLVILLVVAGACAKTAPAPTTQAPAPTTPAASPTPTPVQPIVLKAQTFFNETHDVSKAYVFWITELEKRTNGKVKVDWVYGDPYGKHANVFDLVSGGVVDFAHLLPSYTPGRLPLMEFSGTFPFDWKSGREVAYVHNKLAEKGYFNKELSSGPFVYLFGMQGAPYDFFTKAEVHAPPDLKGMKIRAAGGVMSRFIEAVGAIPVSMASAEQVVALQKGVIDGTILQVASVYSMKLYESVKFQCVTNLSTWYGPMCTIPATWNKLPADVQKVIKDLALEASEKAASFYDASGEAAMNKFPELGLKIYRPTAAEMTQWTAPTKSLLDEEVAKLKAAGYPMDDLMRDFEQFRKEFRAKNP